MPIDKLFDLYAEHGCLNAATCAANGLGLRSKRHVFSTGRQQGGNPFSRGQVHRILTNPVYLGLIRHKEKTWPGTHAAIIDKRLWDQVQGTLQSASAKRRGAPAGSHALGPAPLKGKFRDETGDRLTPTHTQRRGKRLRYYVSNRLVSGGTDPAAWRLPAPAFETAVAGIVADHFTDHAKRHAVLGQAATAAAAQHASEAVAKLATSIDEDGIARAAPLIHSGRIGDGRISITLDPRALAEAAGLGGDEPDPALLSIDAPFTCRRRGVEMKIVAGDRSPAPDATLLRALRNAHRWAEALISGRSLLAIAREEKVSRRYIARILPLSGLSPALQAAIVQGTQPIDLTLQRLLSRPLPLDWKDQQRLLGIPG